MPLFLFLLHDATAERIHVGTVPDWMTRNKRFISVAFMLSIV